jgi:calmodulin
LQHLLITVFLVFRHLGFTITDREVINLFNEVDDDDPNPDFAGFIDLLSRHLRNLRRAEGVVLLKEALKPFDKDGSGFIDADELRSVSFSCFVLLLIHLFFHLN